MSLGNGSVFENAGTFELWSDAGVSGGSQSEFRNTGTLVKTGGTGTANVATGNYGSTFAVGQITNSGVIDLRVGTMGLGFPNTTTINSGSITSQPGTSLWLLGTQISTGTIDCERVIFHFGTATVSGSFRAQHTEVYSQLATVAFSGSILGLGAVVVGSGVNDSGGTLDLTGATFVGSAATFDSLTIFANHPAVTAKLITNEDITVTGLFQWSGSLVGQGSVTANGGTRIHTAGVSLGGGFDYLNPGGAADHDVCGHPPRPRFAIRERRDDGIVDGLRADRRRMDGRGLGRRRVPQQRHVRQARRLDDPARAGLGQRAVGRPHG